MWKLVEFYKNKSIQMLELGSNLPNLAKICQHNYTSLNFYPITERDKFCFQKFGKLWMEDCQRCLHVKLLKLLLTELTSADSQKLELMLANFTFIQCVNLCLNVSTKDMSFMLTCRDSSPISTNLEVSKVRLCRIFDELARAAALRASTQQ